MRVMLAIIAMTSAGALSAAVAETAKQTPADRDWAVFEQAAHGAPPASIIKNEAAMEPWLRERSARIRKLALAFYNTYTGDPRRWEAVREIFDQVSDAQDDPSTPVDEAAQWNAQLEALHAAIEKSADVPEDARATVAGFYLMQDVMSVYGIADDSQLAKLQQKIDGYAARFPHSENALEAQNLYLSQLHERDPKAVEPLLRKLQSSPNEAISAAAKGQLELIRARTVPIDMKFTALDGREVDLARLRGKIVLIDFWATWCGSCLEEMPNVRAAYEKYQPQGLEVIGVALDDADAREAVIACVSKHRMSWPQYFDGNGWKNEYRQRYGINGIPATLLLKRDGTLAAFGLRGPDLQTAVEKLLGAPDH